MQRRLAENVGPDEAEYIEAWRRVENDVPEPLAGILRPGYIDSPRPEPGNATAIDEPVQARVVGQVAPVLVDQPHPAMAEHDRGIGAENRGAAFQIGRAS